jgi:hypothetical protein
MTLSRKTALELMALADGELDGEAKERAEELVARNEEARRLVGALRANAPVIQAWLGEAIGQHSRSADGIADAVMAKLAGSVGSMAGPSGPESFQSVPSARSKRYQRFAQVGVAAGAIAMAAIVALFVRSTRRGYERVPVANVDTPTSTTSAPAPVAAASALGETARSGRGVEVEEIDSAKRVSIFEISGATASAESSVVVWIDDEPEEK